MRNVMKMVAGSALMAAALTATPALAKDRQGTVVAMDPIENRGADETQGTKAKKGIGRALGGIGGMILGSKVSSEAMMAGAVLAPKAGEAAAKLVDKPLPTQYMVKVKLDDGKTLNLSQYRVNLNGVAVGSRVNVSGKGSDARIVPLAATAPATAAQPVPTNK